jgi:hypothetical protein
MFSNASRLGLVASTAGHSSGALAPLVVRDWAWLRPAISASKAEIFLFDFTAL